MSSAIQNILHSTIGDGARSSKFEVQINLTDENSGISSNDIVMMGKTSSFPGKSHTTIDLKYRGRSIPVKGQTKYSQTWECSFILTNSHKLKNAFENWIEALDVHNYAPPANNIKELQKKHVKSYVRDIVIQQRNFDDTKYTSKYTLHNAFPTETSSVNVNYESRGEILEVTITFSFSHFTVSVMNGPDGNFVDDLLDKAQSATNEAILGATSTAGDAINGWLGNEKTVVTRPASADRAPIGIPSSENDSELAAKS